MRVLAGALAVAGLMACVELHLTGQTIDSLVTEESRAPRSSILDEIRDPAERAAFANLLQVTDPHKLLALARAFLNQYPQSAFLAFAAEKAARASFDLGDLQAGLQDTRLSLKLLPENPLLLVAAADVEARLQQNDAAIADARDALDYFDRFARPAAISKRDWPALKSRQQATAWFVIGRALVNEALAKSVEDRPALLAQARNALANSNDLEPEDMEAVYLSGLVYRYCNDLPHAVVEFSTVYREHGELSKEAYEQLQALYAATKPTSAISFEAFIDKLQGEASPIGKPAAVQTGTEPATHLGDYAGSAACKQCHSDVYRNWSESGMSRMLRPYRPENVLGDFEKNNQFFAGDEIVYEDGKLTITPGASSTLFARMTIRDGRHSFDIKQSDGLWHSYPVDYTIGSKWQQAYATRLPNGEIHVFPIQYSLIEKRWLNYWKVIDAPGSERANPLNWEKLDDSTNYMINCAVCHTSQLRNAHGGGFDADNLAFREPGVDCEMCHGPSANHIAAMHSGSYADKRPLDPPVDFERINNRDFVAICAQCHMQSNLHADSARGELNYSTRGAFFLKNPELPLGEFTRETFFKDGRFRQTTFMVEALERSECFRKGQVNCGSCHDPHSHDESSNVTSLKFKDDPDRMCTGCHTQFQDKARAAAHTHHPAASEGSRCVSCHMPRIMDALLFRARSHQIDEIPNAEMTLRFGQSASPNACLLCHTEKTAQWVQSELQDWRATR
jgi:predicted CXXCH cytochrome family protein